MKIHSTKLQKAMQSKGVSAQQLAEVVAAPANGTTPASREARVSDATRAVNNWLDGKDHPRCDAKSIKQIAQYLGVRTVDLCTFTSRICHHRGSPRKAKLLTDLIKGKRVDQALNLLTFNTKRAAVNIKRCLNAAITDAEAAEADTTQLFVTESRVDNGPVMKRFQPKDRGRAHAIHKPFSHITISVEEKPAR
ncbi:MAG: 50S ribosomal protein L22 [Phycisphaerales bacterium]